jgi:hypothetical protein
MAKRPPSTPKRTYATGRTLSGSLATLLTAIADRLVLLNATSAQGALLRSLLVPPLRITARVLRWWSRSYIGQRLGLNWSAQTISAGFRHTYEPADIGDAWRDFERGQVTLKPPAKR